MLAHSLRAARHVGSDSTIVCLWVMSIDRVVMTGSCARTGMPSFCPCGMWVAHWAPDSTHFRHSWVATDESHHAIRRAH